MKLENCFPSSTMPSVYGNIIKDDGRRRKYRLDFCDEPEEYQQEWMAKKVEESGRRNNKGNGRR